MHEGGRAGAAYVNDEASTDCAPRRDHQGSRLHPETTLETNCDVNEFPDSVQK